MLNFAKIPWRNWTFAVAILSISGIIALLGDSGRELYSYQSGLFSRGETWRAVSGHLTHLGWPHLFLNAFGLLGVWSLYAKEYSAFSWAIIFLFCAFGISAGFAIFDSELRQYVGLSGVLHGLLGAAAMKSLLTARHSNDGFPLEDIFVLAALGLKIAYEKLIGSIPFTSALSGGGVIVNAHFYGAIIGVVLGGACGFLCKVRIRSAV